MAQSCAAQNKALAVTMMIAIIQRRSAGKPRESHGPIGPGCLEDLVNPAVDLFH